MKHFATSAPLIKYLVLIFFLYLLLASIGLVKWQLNNSMEIWFYEDDPQLITHKKVLDEMGEWEWLVVVLDTKANIYDKKFLDELHVLGNQVADLDNVKKVISIANARGTFEDENGLKYRVLYNSNSTTPSSIDEELRQNLLKNPTFVDSLFKEGQENTTILLVQDANAFNDGGPVRVQLIENIKTIMNGATLIADYWIVGNTALNAELNTYSLRDVFIFYPLVFAVCIIFGWWVFGNWRDLTVAFSIISAVVATTVSTMVYGGVSLNMVTVMLPAILTTLSMANLIHVITHFHHLREARPEDSLSEIAIQVVRDLWIPCFGAAFTTIVGFVSLLSAGIIPVIQLGAFAAMAIFLGFLLSISVAPLLLVYFWSNKRNIYIGKSRSLAAYASRVLPSVARNILNTTRPIIFLFCFISIAGMTGLHFLKADSSYLMMFNEDSDIRNSYKHVEKNGFAASNIRILLEMENGLEDPMTFLSLDELQKAINKLSQVTKVVSPLDGFKEIDRALAKNEFWTQENYFNYDRATFAQLLFVSELSNNDDMKDLLLPGNTVGQIFIFTDYLANSEVKKLVNEIENLITKHLPPEVKAHVAGMPVLWANMDQELIAAQIAGVIVVSIAILLTLLIITHSISLSVVGLAVNLLPVMTIVGLMAWLDISLNMGTVLIGSIALGLAVDDTIHFLWQYVNERRNGVSVQEALIVTIRLTGLAIFLTSMIIAAGFSVMMLSQFIPTADFGLFTTSAILLAMLADLLLLPAILMVLYGNKIKRIEVRT